MTGPRLTDQLQLAFAPVDDRLSSAAVGEGAEPVVAKGEPERPVVTPSVMEAVCERENLKKALRRVKANKGSPGVDGMTVDALPDYLRVHWPRHRDELLDGTYTPSPVKRVEIPKSGGGVRKLGVPTLASHCTSYNTASGFFCCLRILMESRTRVRNASFVSSSRVIQYGEPLLRRRAVSTPRSIQ